MLMNAGVIAVAALLMATDATATRPKDEAGPSASTAQTKKKKAAPKDGKGAAAGPGDPAKKAATPGATPAQAAVKRAKSTFMYAVESCAIPSRCDAALRDDAEKSFLDACQACATQERCEAERDAIKGGSARSTTNPCAP